MSDRIFLVGGSRNTGLEVARILRAQQCDVIALVRSTSDASELAELGVEIQRGDVLVAESLFPLVAAANCSTIICSLGGQRGEPRPDFDGLANLVAAASRSGIRRFILVTAIGAGDSRAVLSDQAWKFLGPVIELKSKAETCLQQSGLDWTILRPGGMRSAPATGTAVRSTDHSAMGMINRADLAQLVVDCLSDPDSVGKIYHTVDPVLAEQPPLQRGEVLQPGAAKP